MSIETVLRNQVLIDAPLLNGRFYPVKLKQNTGYPAARYNRISAIRGLTHNGSDGLVTARFQIDVFDKTFDGARAAADEIRKSLHGEIGNQILSGELDNESDDWEDDTGLYKVQADFIISYCE